MSDPVENLAVVLGSLQDSVKPVVLSSVTPLGVNNVQPLGLDNVTLAERLGVLSDAYAEMQEEISVQARELQDLRDQVRRMAGELETD